MKKIKSFILLIILMTLGLTLTGCTYTKILPEPIPVEDEIYRVENTQDNTQVDLL